MLPARYCAAITTGARRMTAFTRRIGATILSGLLAWAVVVPAVGAAQTKRVLIAAERSTVKDAVVARVAEALRRDGHAVRIIALEQVTNEPIGDYQAVLLVDSCRAWRPSLEVRDLLERASADVKQRLVVVTTAASGECALHTPGVDALSAASKRTRIEELSHAILDRIRSRLTSP
jgi:hypothetical protein